MYEPETSMIKMNSIEQAFSYKKIPSSGRKHVSGPSMKEIILTIGSKDLMFSVPSYFMTILVTGRKSHHPKQVIIYLYYLPISDVAIFGGLTVKPILSCHTSTHELTIRV